MDVYVSADSLYVVADHKVASTPVRLGFTICDVFYMFCPLSIAQRYELQRQTNYKIK